MVKLIFGEVVFFPQKLRILINLCLTMAISEKNSIYSEIVGWYLQYTLWWRFSFHTGFGKFTTKIVLSRAHSPYWNVLFLNKEFCPKKIISKLNIEIQKNAHWIYLQNTSLGPFKFKINSLVTSLIIFKKVRILEQVV